LATCSGSRQRQNGGVEGVRLGLVESKFEFPALMVERDELGGGIGDGIEERGEEEVGAEVAVMDAHGAHAASAIHAGSIAALLEARRSLSRADGEFGLPSPTAPTSCGETNYSRSKKRS